MRAAWRLALSVCSARPSRVVLLTAAVAMSTALVAAVACAMASLDAAVKVQLDAAIGTAQARVQPADGGVMDAGVLERVSTWQGVEQASPRLESALTLVARLPTIVEQLDGRWQATPQTYRVNAFVTGVDLDAEFAARPPKLIDGRLPTAPGEVLIDAALARRLSHAEATRTAATRPFDPFADPLAYRQQEPVEPDQTASGPTQAATANAGVGVRLGDELTVIRSGSGPSVIALLRGARAVGTLRIVGIAAAPPLGGKPTATVDLATAQALADSAGKLSRIEIELDGSIDPEAFVLEHAEELGGDFILQTTERITSGVEKNLAASQLGLVLVGAVALLCAGFIIMTGLSTGVAEQQRTLAVLRCVGAKRGQIGFAQLLAGLLVGCGGAMFGVPLGVLMTFVLSRIFERQMPEGLVIPPVMLTLVVAGSLAAGLLGALWPAWRAASLSPLEGLAARSVPASSRGIGRMLVISLSMMLTMAGIVVGVREPQAFFWLYALVGLPLMFVGYFLFSVPVVVVTARVFGPIIARMLGIPSALLTRTVRSTPYRHGFTAGALMTGLALMVGIWTNGGSALRDWIGKIRFPDAFAAGLSISEDAEGLIAGVPGVRRTTPISMTVVEIDTFGVKGLSEYKTQFFGLDFRTLSDMFEVQFAEGDRETAIQRLEAGGAVIVAREFQAARRLGVGDTFTCRYNGVEHHFEIVGVVLSPGLEFISQFFDFGGSFVNQTVSSVVGSSADAAEKFGVTRPMIIGIELDPTADETASVAAINEATLGTGVLNVGSGRLIREQITAIVRSTLAVFTTVAIGAMLVACFGVANLIIAEVQSRRFELGVIRSVGGSRAQMVKLVCGQALLIGLSASILGTLLGIQSAWGGQTVNQRIIGIELSVRPPLDAIALGWVTAVLMALLAAAPTAWRIARASPRELLAARG